MGTTRPVPTDEELKQVLLDCCGSVHRMAKHYHAGFNTARKWLLAAGLIDENNQPIEYALKPAEPVDDELPVCSMGCVEPPKATTDEYWRYAPGPISDCEPTPEENAETNEAMLPMETRPAPVVEKEFNRHAFALDVIDSVIELSEVYNVPPEVTVRLIGYVLVEA